MSEEELRDKFPLHWAVWEDDVEGLSSLLESERTVDIDAVDPRGRTPLMLAVTLNRPRCASQLLRRGANADAQNKDMWSVSHEAISSGNEAMVREIIKYRDYQRMKRACSDMKTHLNKLKESPDFYAEMSWEFSSWMPFVSKLCPSDTYKIYKRGSSVRIDTTLVGFEGHSWQRGQQTFIFRVSSDVPQIVIIDHLTATASVQSLTVEESLEDFDPPEEAVYYRMTSPTSTTFIDMDRIGFERSKGSGLLSWIGSGDKRERVSGYDCKIFNASNVDLVTKTRSEHLTEEHKARFKQEESSNALSSLLNMVRSENASSEGTSSSTKEVTALEYFNLDIPLDRDIGRPRSVTRKSNSFKATLYLAEKYPLSLQDQVAPIVALMSSSSAHFARLSSFMRLQLPSGFPVKIEIPLFHLVSAKITFGRINETVDGVVPLSVDCNTTLSDNVDGVPLLASSSPGVDIDPKLFDIPDDYRVMDDQQSSHLWWPEEGETATGTHPHRHVRPSAQDQEDMLLQMAIEQSLLQSAIGNAPLAIEGARRSTARVLFDDEERQLALAIERSLQDVQGPSNSGNEERLRAPTPVEDMNNVLPPSHTKTLAEQESEMLELAMRLSLEDEERRRRQREEDEGDDELKRAIALSMNDM